MKLLFITAFFVMISSHSLLAWNLKDGPSEFHLFTDKQNKQIDARVLAISDDQKDVRIERRDGQVFDIAATVLSLDDQQFIKDWLFPKPAITSGTLHCFGNLPKDQPIDATLANGITDIVELGALRDGWMVRRSNGEVLAFAERRRGHTQAARIYANTIWSTVTKEDGTVWGLPTTQHLAKSLNNIVYSVAGGGHQAGILPDGTVKVWGSKYGTGKVFDPPAPLSNIIDLAANNNSIAALSSDGVVTCWTSGESEVKSAKLGDGVIAVAGGVFNLKALTKSGEVYQWSGRNIDKAKIPTPAASDGPYQKLRSTGATHAVQKADGSWLAWGKNGGGIVDHINNLGPVPDIALFTEPNSSEAGYVIWLSP